MMRPTPKTSHKIQETVELFGEDGLEGDFLSDLDKAFEAIQITPKSVPRNAPTVKRRKREREMLQMQNTFVAVTQVHLRPTLRYLKAIRLGVASRDLCEIVHYVVGPIIGKTRKVGLDEHTRALIAFQRVLKNSLKSRNHRITLDQQKELAAAFIPVEKVFRLDFRGHSTAVVNLLGYYKALKRNPEVTETEMKKLFAIGIPSLTMLRKSSVEELVSLSGVEPEKMWTLRRSARQFSILSLV
ncbi:MAG: hypothetical protein V1798_01795 [Pseudomonadota bacterium]